jgi:hypothetical protein
MIKKLSKIILVIFLFTSSSVVAQTFDPAKAGQSVVKIVAYRGADVLREGTGAFVDVGGVVVTNWHLSVRADRITVISLATGAELAAEIAAGDEDLDLIILKVEGLQAPPLFFSVRSAAEADIVRSLGNWDGAGQSIGALAIDTATGAVGSLAELEIDRDRTANFVIHNALILRQGYGGPLVNACGEIVGLNRPDPALSNRRVRQGTDPDQAVHALSAATLKAFLVANQVQPNLAVSECLTEIERAALSTEQAEAEKDEAERAAAAAKAVAQEAERRAEQLERKALEAQQEAETSAEDKRRAQEAARRARAEAQRKAIEANELEARAQKLETRIHEAEEIAEAAREAEAESQRRLYLGLAAAAAVILLLLLVSMIMIRRRSRAISEVEGEVEAAKVEAAMARAEAAAAVPSVWNNCLLEGSPVSLKLPGTAIPADVGGVVVGRHPSSSTVVFDDASISRSHARFYASGDEVFVEDLGSTNGTLVEGEKLEPNAPQKLADGQTVTLGRHDFIFRVLS